MTISLAAALRIRVLVIGATLTLIGILLSVSTAQAQPISLRGAAERALHYLGTQQLADGSIQDTASETEDYILGTTASGPMPWALGIWVFVGVPSSGNGG